MSLTKTVSVDQITVENNGIVIFREATLVLENGVELSKTYHRTPVYPGQNLTGKPDNVIAICNVVWTPKIVADFKAALEAK
jgi:hypothetical protein